MCKYSPGRNTEDMFFFTPRDRKCLGGKRPNRSAKNGFWKATGKDSDVIDGQTGELIGYKTVLSYYQGTHSDNKKTKWLMHEYHVDKNGAIPPSAKGAPAPNMKLDHWVLCRVYKNLRKEEMKLHQEPMEQHLPPPHPEPAPNYYSKLSFTDPIFESPQFLPFPPQPLQQMMIQPAASLMNINQQALPFYGSYDYFTDMATTSHAPVATCSAALFDHFYAPHQSANQMMDEQFWCCNVMGNCSSSSDFMAAVDFPHEVGHDMKMEPGSSFCSQDGPCKVQDCALATSSSEDFSLPPSI